MRASHLLVLLGACALVSCKEKPPTVDLPVPPDAGPECKEDADCGKDRRCQDGKCADVKKPTVPSCKSSADCLPRVACRDLKCVAAVCANDGECESGESCSNGLCELKGCRLDADCDPGKRCAAKTHACVECESDDECPTAKPVCRADGKCIDCASDADCAPPKAPFCSKATGSCTHCLTDLNCPAGLRCASGTCVGGKSGDKCDAKSLCSPGLICVNTGAAGTVCLEKCDVYTPGCQLGLVCIRLGDGSGALIFEQGRPIGVCISPAPDGAKLDESCGGTLRCQYHLFCVPEAYGKGRCRRLCDPKLKPPPCAPGTTCNPIDAGFSKNEVLGICYTQSDWFKDCDDDKGCGAGLACTISADPKDYDGYGTRCGYSPPGATKGPNEACAKDEECKSGFCLKDAAGKPLFCYGACVDDSPCTGGFCDDYNFTFSNGTPTPDQATIKGCHLSCKSNAACAGSAGAACVTRVKPAQGGKPASVFGECGQTMGVGEIGASCKTSAECRNARCVLSDPRGIVQPGYCTGFCEQDADCKGGLSCPKDGVVLKSGSDYLAVKMCGGALCAADADCTATGLGACRVDLSPLKPRTEFVQRCGPPIGTGALAASCTKDQDCASGTCFDPGTGSRICFGACVPGAAPSTCPSGTTCKADVAAITTIGGATQKLASCAP